MTATHHHFGFESTFNVIGAFPGDQRTRVVSALDKIGVPESAITVHRPDQEPDGEEITELVAEMQDELVHPWRRSAGHHRGDERLAAERDLLVAVHVENPRLIGRAAAVLRGLGAEEVHLVAAGGVPLPAQAQHPRPADPDGFWWTHANRG